MPPESLVMHRMGIQSQAGRLASTLAVQNDTPLCCLMSWPGFPMHVSVTNRRHSPLIVSWGSGHRLANLILLTILAPIQPYSVSNYHLWIAQKNAKRIFSPSYENGQHALDVAPSESARALL